MRVATGLMACGAIPNPEMPFNSELTRFEQRFSAFGFMQRPLPLVYEQYTAAMDLSGEKTLFATPYAVSILVTNDITCCCSTSPDIHNSIDSNKSINGYGRHTAGINNGNRRY